MDTKPEYERCSLVKVNKRKVGCAVALFLLLPVAAWAGGVVTNCTETALRAAMAEGGVVTFACDGTITLGDTIVIGINTVLDCTGHQVTISGGGSKRVFYVNTNISFTAINLTIAHGAIAGSQAFGGAIYNSGTVILDLCTLTSNSASGATWGSGSNGDAAGGAIFSEGTLTVDRTTLCGNIATGGWSDATTPFSGASGGEAKGAAICNLGNMAVERSLFVSNTIVGGTGGNGLSGGTGPPPGPAPGGGGMGGTGGDAYGGALFVGGPSSLVNCTLTGNQARGGHGGEGGNSAIIEDPQTGTWWYIVPGGSGGSGGAACGAVYDATGALRLTNCTIAFNSSEAGLGGVGGLGNPNGLPATNSMAVGGLQTANGIPVNCLLAGNSPTDGTSGLVDAGHNLSSDASCAFTNIGSMNSTDPKLGPLGNNGGPTLTMALLPGSPAIDAGDTLAAPTTDQRGFPRPVGPAADIGAFEYGTPICAVVTLAATAVTATNAILNATVNPNGSRAAAWFLWGTSTSYGNLTAVTGMGSSTNYLLLSVPLAGLTPNTLYHFRVAATNSPYALYGIDQSFTTLGPPLVSTMPAMDVSANSATLNGTISPQGWPTTAWFQWGATTNYGNLTSVGDLGSGTTVLPLSVPLAGLTPSVTYHFRIAATNHYGLVYGSDLSFTTESAEAHFNYTTNNGTITITGYTGPGGAMTIPSMITGLPVTSIGDQAFYQCTSLTGVTIPNSVTSIGNWAFRLTSLTSVTIPDSVTNVGNSAFFDSGLTNVAIGSGLTNIGDSAFRACYGLSAITVDARNSSYSSMDGVLLDKSQTTLVQYPGGKAGNYTIPNGVTSIGDYAFAFCTSLTSITIGFSVTSVGDGAFYDCTGLTALHVGGNAFSLGGSSVFAYTSVTVYYLPGTTGWGATFGGRPTALWYLPNPLILTSGPGFGMQSNAFGFIISWAANLPVVVEASTNPANHSWSPLKTNTLTGGSAYFSDPQWTNYPGRFYRLRSSSSLADFTYLTNNDMITISGYHGPGGAVTIPDTVNGLPVTAIADTVFENCESLTSLTFGANVTHIGRGECYGCRNLASVTIPNRVTNIGDYAFWGCTSLTAITVGARNLFYSSLDGVLFNKSQTTLIHCPGAKAGSYTIPNSVTEVGDEAFDGCTSLTSVTIGDGVTSIGIVAFNSCTRLTQVIIGNNVASIWDEAFQGCISLTNVTIPNSVTNIHNLAFNSCINLTQVTMGNNVASIGDGAFQSCISLTNVTIPNSVTFIGGSAFYNCTSLTHLTIPNSVTFIGDDAFQICSGLTNITIGNSVASIGHDAFSQCTSLTGVYFMGDAPDLGSDAFDSDNFAIVFYLPGTTGWGGTFGGRPVALWIQVPTVQTAPQSQTAEAGSAVDLSAHASSVLPLFYVWYLNGTTLISAGVNEQLELTNVRLDQSGAYTVVISNVVGAITSAPAMLNVIAPVERRPVPGIEVTGETASLLNVDYANSLSPAPNWTTLGSVSLTSTTGYCCDPTLPLPPQRFYRAWQTGTPGVRPSLDLRPVPAITLTGTIGHSVRLDYINQFGPTDAWVTLATVPLTNTSQLFFDVSAPGQPQRLYRLVPSP